MDENELKYDFDYDEEKTGFRKTVGKICIGIGILLLIFTSNFFVRDARLAITGKNVKATVKDREGNFVAVYEANGKTNVYDMGGYRNRFHRKMVKVYYQDNVSDAIFINWGMYILSYVLYAFIVFIGICNIRDRAVKDEILKLFKKREKK